MKINAGKTFESLQAAVKQINLAAEKTEVILEKGFVYQADQTLEICAKAPVVLIGEGACLSGKGDGIGILIRSGNVTVQDLLFQHFFIGIEIEADGESVRDIKDDLRKLEELLGKLEYETTTDLEHVVSRMFTMRKHLDTLQSKLLVP